MVFIIHNPDRFLYQTLTHTKLILSLPQITKNQVLGNEGQLLKPRACQNDSKYPILRLLGTSTSSLIPSHENPNRCSGLCSTVHPTHCFLTSPGASMWGFVCRAQLLLPGTCECKVLPLCQSFQWLCIIPHWNKIIPGTNLRIPPTKGLLRRTPDVRGQMTAVNWLKKAIYGRSSDTKIPLMFKMQCVWGGGFWGVCCRGVYGMVCVCPSKDFYKKKNLISSKYNQTYLCGPDNGGRLLAVAAHFLFIS